MERLVEVEAQLAAVEPEAAAEADSAVEEHPQELLVTTAISTATTVITVLAAERWRLMPRTLL